MTRTEVIKVAKKQGFKPWGALRKRSGSSYQCFRKGNHYAWIGLRYIEIDTNPVACDFIIATPQEVNQFLSE